MAENGTELEHFSRPFQHARSSNCACLLQLVVNGIGFRCGTRIVSPNASDYDTIPLLVLALFYWPFK